MSFNKPKIKADTFMGDLVNALLLRPPYRKPEEPKGYGYDRTIHQTGEVNVELDKDGKVVSVWYRCRTLPFTQTIVDDERAGMMRDSYVDYPAPGIEAIVFQGES